VLNFADLKTASQQLLTAAGVFKRAALFIRSCLDEAFISTDMASCDVICISLCTLCLAQAQQVTVKQITYSGNREGVSLLALIARLCAGVEARFLEVIISNFKWALSAFFTSLS
jgi:hypothetical protein